MLSPKVRAFPRNAEVGKLTQRAFCNGALSPRSE